MSRSGCHIEQNSKGLYDLTVFDGGQTVLVLTDLTLHFAAARAEAELYAPPASER